MAGIFTTEKLGTFTVRLAEQEDYQPIVQLLKDTAKWLKEKGVKQWDNFLREEANDVIKAEISKGITYIVEKNNEIVATFTISSEQNDWDIELWGKREDPAYYIHRFAVNRNYKNLHIGNQLLHWMAENINIRNGYIRLDCLADNEALNTFYQQAGFTFIGYGYAGKEKEKFSTYERYIS